MEDQIKSKDGKYLCIECQNENEVPADVKVGDVIECQFCGIEYEVIEKDADGNVTLSIVEEEK